MMRIERDLDADAVYVVLSESEIFSTSELSDGTIVDVGADQNLLGVEILSATRGWSAEVAAIAFPEAAEDLATIETLLITTTSASRERSALATSRSTQQLVDTHAS